MMSRMVKMLAAVTMGCILLAVAAWFLLKPVEPEPDKTGAEQLLADRDWQEVSAIAVENEHGSYTVKKQAEGSYTVHDIPDAVVNQDYVAMLLDECSRIAYVQAVETSSGQAGTYGLDKPSATVTVTYTDQTSVKLLLGLEESISKGRYAMLDGGETIVLLKGGRCVRFFMPVENYINFIMIPPNESTDVLRALGDVEFGGSRFAKPVRLKAVTKESGEETLRQAASFGAVTHMITEPVMHEANPTELTAVADSLMGLISEGVVAYNCTPEQLSSYGFDEPIMTVEFDYINREGEEPRQIGLKLSQLEDGTGIVTLDGQGIIYKIANVAFTETTYDRLVLRWFLTPLLTDVSVLEMEAGGRQYRFEANSPKPKELNVTLDGQEVDAKLYRQFYNLVVSAAADGPMLETEMECSGTPVMEIRFRYRDEEKEADIMKLYEGPVRRLYVEVNGVCEYTIREKYADVVLEALQALPKNSNFSQDW